VRVLILVILVASLGLTTSATFDLFNILGLPDIFEDDLSRASPQV
jgi:hypothetical protein